MSGWTDLSLVSMGYSAVRDRIPNNVSSPSPITQMEESRRMSARHDNILADQVASLPINVCVRCREADVPLPYLVGTDSSELPL